MAYLIKKDELFHEGRPHEGSKSRSGRYPWGSGDTPYQRITSFLDMTDSLKKDGLSEKEIAKQLGFKSTSELRDYKSLAKSEKRIHDIATIKKLQAKGYSNSAIGKELGVGESQVRSLMKETVSSRQKQFEVLRDNLKSKVEETGYLDVGSGTEALMNISETKKSKLIRSLVDEGYTVHVIKERQQTTGEYTNTKVLTKPGVTFQDVVDNRDKIKPYSGSLRGDDEVGALITMPPLSISKDRVKINYAEDGGTKADGVMFVRPGVKDISLGKNHYAQVRVMVNDTHYLKGMAVYKDDLPDGVDILFNTNKTKDVPMLGSKDNSVLKPLKDDKDNPFGATISKQIISTGSDGKKRVTSAMNIVNDDDDWDTWSRNLPSQFLSKQSLPLIRTQLELSQSRKKAELEKILSLENPVVRKHMLMQFADSADASSVHLKAAALPRQKTHVILPVNSLKETEIYAPNFKNGDRVVLIRYPHAGTFEIPELTVNNRHAEARKIIGEKSKAAVGINHKVAERLSGADFDGDTVVVIPNNSGHIKSTKALEGLRDFDPHVEYGYKPGIRLMTNKKQTGSEMGKITNLISDMSIKGASMDEITRAVRHSMVVIDAEKHRLDYMQSYADNDIASLKRKYQGGVTRGASTIISRASSRLDVDERILRRPADGGPIDAKTGELVYVPTGRTYKPVGKESAPPVKARQTITKMEGTKDARTLVSKEQTPVELLYADHANAMKALANRARREYVNTRLTPYSPEAYKEYHTEVQELNAALRIAKQNAPRERQAQRLAGLIVKAKLNENPNLEKEDLKKLKAQALTKARERTGAKKARIEPTPRQWEAIQAGAISTSKLQEILRNGNMDAITQLALPKHGKSLSASEKSTIKSMHSRGYTQAEIAEALGISTSTVMEYV